VRVGGADVKPATGVDLPPRRLVAGWASASASLLASPGSLHRAFSHWRCGDPTTVDCALRLYAQTNAYGIATNDKLLTALSQRCGMTADEVNSDRPEQR
jgi:hypothetical protein